MIFLLKKILVKSTGIFYIKTKIFAKKIKNKKLSMHLIIASKCTFIIRLTLTLLTPTFLSQVNNNNNKRLQ